MLEKLFFTINTRVSPSDCKEIIPDGDFNIQKEINNGKKIAPVAQLVKNLPAVQETWVRFLGREDPLEKEMATHSSSLAWRIPRTNRGAW